jgi:hypothetical protein
LLEKLPLNGLSQKIAGSVNCFIQSRFSRLHIRRVEARTMRRLQDLEKHFGFGRAPREVLRNCREAEEGIAMPKSARLRLILTDVDPTMSVAQTVHAEERVPAQTLRRKLPIGWKVWLSAAVFASAIVLTSAGLSESPHQATAIMERLAAKAEAAREIAPETQDAVFELLATPHYNCDRIKCDERLTVRNRLARERIRRVVFGDADTAAAAEQATSSR